MKILINFILLVTCIHVNAQELHIFGGRGHDVYLGCLTCNNYSSNSIWNEYSQYGSSYNANSIWNTYSDYGSSFSDYSPLNVYAKYPPVIVDMDGSFYGYFTVNIYANKRATFNLVSIIYEHHSDICDDVSEWYDIIFE